jgi:hypothetical protein
LWQVVEDTAITLVDLGPFSVCVDRRSGLSDLAFFGVEGRLRRGWGSWRTGEIVAFILICLINIRIASKVMLLGVVLLVLGPVVMLAERVIGERADSIVHSG